MVAPNLKPPPALPPKPAIAPPATTGKAPGLKKLGKIEIAAPRILINGVEGIGKTTVGAHAPDAAILMSRGETGFPTLRSAGLVPDCDCVEIPRWLDLLAQLDEFINTPKLQYKSIVLDAMGGFERLCHEHVCNRDFKGDFGEKGFSCYNRGYDLSVNDWLLLLARLDKLREIHGVAIIILAHTKVKTFKNPSGMDFDRYACDCHDKTWSVTHKWADAVMFFNFRQVLEENQRTKKAKAIGDCRERVMFTERHDSYDAKNRYGMPPEIVMPDEPWESWNTLWNAINVSKTQPE